jgi:hypothetical protein
MELDLSEQEAGLVEVYEAFKKYIIGLSEVCTDKLPDMINEAENLTDQAEKAKDRAEDEFADLGAMKKGQALLSFAVNLKYCAKIPTFFKSEALKLKTDLEELKTTAENIKAEGPKYVEHGKDCNKAGLKLPVECRRKIDGPIFYTPATRAHWEKFMHKRAEKQWPRETFNPLDFPTTDQKDSVPENN